MKIDKTNKIELIKYIAILSMVMDHVGVVFFDGNEVFRFIGRFALVGFAYVLTYNYRFHTKNKQTYRTRIALWAIISQLPYVLIVDNHLQMNILFLLYFSLVAIDTVDYIIKNDNVIFPVILLFVILIISWFTGYFIFGVVLIVSMYYAHDSKNAYRISILSTLLLNFSFLYAASAFISYSIINYIVNQNKTPFQIKRINKYFFYAFYPGHLIVLLLMESNAILLNALSILSNIFAITILPIIGAIILMNLIYRDYYKK